MTGWLVALVVLQFLTMVSLAQIATDVRKLLALAMRRQLP